MMCFQLPEDSVDRQNIDSNESIESFERIEICLE